MHNITELKPTDALIGRPRVAMNLVDDIDIKDKKILDIGCGYGWCELNFLERGAAAIVGTEITEKDFETAKKFIKDPRVTFDVGGATKLDYPDKSFDTVVCWEVIEHIPKNTEDKMFKEVNRVLKKDGTFYLSTPYAALAAKLFDPAWWLIGHRHYSKDQLENYAKKHGFEVQAMTVRGGIWTLLSILNMYISKWIFRRPPFMAKTFSSKEDYEYWNQEGFFNIFVKYKKVEETK